MAASIAEVAASVSEIAAAWRARPVSPAGAATPRTRRLRPAARRRAARAAGAGRRGRAVGDMATSVRPMCEIYRDARRRRPVGRPRVVDAPGRHRLLAGQPRPVAAGVGGAAAGRVRQRRRRASSGARSPPSPGAAATSPGPGPSATPIDAEPFLPGRHVRGHRRQALRQRLGDHRPDDDDGRPRGRGRPDDLRARRARPAVGRDAPGSR